MKNLLTLAALLAMTLFTIGCADSPAPTPAGGDTPVETDHADHDEDGDHADHDEDGDHADHDEDGDHDHEVNE